MKNKCINCGKDIPDENRGSEFTCSKECRKITETLDFDKYDYLTTDGPRKCWDGEPEMSSEGWEEYADWERFKYHEERYWRKLKKNKESALIKMTKLGQEIESELKEK